MDAGPRQWSIETDNLRGVLGLRGSLNDWDWEVSAQRARSESEQTGSRRQGWVRTDYLQQEIDAGRYNPFGGQIKVNDLPGFNEFFSIEYDTEEEARESLAYHVARIRAEESSAYTQITEWQP